MFLWIPRVVFEESKGFPEKTGAHETSSFPLVLIAFRGYNSPHE